MSRQHILIATNSHETSELMAQALCDQYSVRVVHSIEDVQGYVADDTPALLVIGAALHRQTSATDIMINDGYQLCAELKALEKTHTVPIIMLSAMGGREARLAAYEAGADDFIDDNRDGLSLRYLVEKLLNARADLEKSMREAQSAAAVAMEAMVNSSELGRLVQLLRTVHQIENQQTLADTIRHSIAYFNLSCCVMINGASTVYAGCQPDSLEASLMERFFCSDQRMAHQGNRTLINSSKVALLIKNMPIDEETRYGRFKDLLVMITDVASDRAMAIEAGYTLRMKQQRISMLNKIIGLAEDSVDLSAADIRHFSDSLMNAVRDMVNAQDDLLVNLGLDDDQEERLRTVALVATDKVELAYGRSEDLGKNLTRLLDVLKELLTHQ
jgi:DNA-binding response OmpR family regulator